MRLHHVRAGAGDPLLLVHGLGATLGIWEPVLHLLTAERDVVAVDMPGFGGSPVLANGTAPTAEALARAVLRFSRDELGIERPHVAGNSLGGWVALEMAKVDGIASVTTLSAAGLWRRPLGPRRGLITPRRAGRVLRPLLRPLLRSARVRATALGSSVAHPGRVPPDAAVALITGYMAAPGFAPADLAMRSAVFDHGGLVRVPVTIAHGEHDALVAPPKRLPPGARYVVLRGCGHVPTWDDPEQVAQVLLEGSADAA